MMYDLVIIDELKDTACLISIASQSDWQSAFFSDGSFSDHPAEILETADEGTES